MIRVVFYKTDDHLSGFSMSGHAGYGTSGNDIACASVSSAAELVCNTITDFFNEDADITVDENRLELRLKGSGEASVKLIESFHTHLGFIEEEFPRSIGFSYKNI